MPRHKNTPAAIHEERATLSPRAPKKSRSAGATLTRPAWTSAFEADVTTSPIAAPSDCNPEKTPLANRAQTLPFLGTCGMANSARSARSSAPKMLCNAQSPNSRSAFPLVRYRAKAVSAIATVAAPVNRPVSINVRSLIAPPCPIRRLR